MVAIVPFHTFLNEFSDQEKSGSVPGIVISLAHKDWAKSTFSALGRV